MRWRSVRPAPPHSHVAQTRSAPSSGSLSSSLLPFAFSWWAPFPRDTVAAPRSSGKEQKPGSSAARPAGFCGSAGIGPAIGMERAEKRANEIHKFHDSLPSRSLAAGLEEDGDHPDRERARGCRRPDSDRPLAVRAAGSRWPSPPAGSLLRRGDLAEPFHVAFFGATTLDLETCADGGVPFREWN
jgi:hypothetical protein